MEDKKPVILEEDSIDADIFEKFSIFIDKTKSSKQKKLL